MKALNVERINARSPYQVWAESETEYFLQTAHGVLYNIGFMHDYTLWEEGAYQLIIHNENAKASPRDAKLKQTIFCIIEEFFIVNPAILLYICETGDGRQAMRSRLFLHWFREYKYKNLYFMKSVEIMAEGVDNFAAIFVQRSHPDLVHIIHDFDEMISVLQNKPE